MSMMKIHIQSTTKLLKEIYKSVYYTNARRKKRVFALLTDLIDKYIAKPDKKTKAIFLEYYNSVEPYLQNKWKYEITTKKTNELNKSIDLALALIYKEELKNKWKKR